MSDQSISPISRDTILSPEDHLCPHEPSWLPAKPYLMLFVSAVEASHQASTLVNMEKMLQSRFTTTTYSVLQKGRKQGRLQTEHEIKEMINDFDIFLMQCGKPVFDFSFYKQLKEINPRLLIVYLDGDSHMNFPTYTQWFIKDVDLFVSVDSIDVSDFVAQLGCRSICLGNVISERDFYPIQGIDKDINVSFYGGPKGDRREFLSFLQQKDIGLQCFGDSFGGVRLSQIELNRVINRTKIGLSFNKHNYVRDKIRMPRNFIISRQMKGHIFEHMMCRTFMLSEYVENSQRFFVEGKEIVSFEGKPDLLDKILYYLEHDVEREAIAEAGYSKTMAHYEGTIQIAKMINLVVKCANMKQGRLETFSSVDTGYQVKPLSAQGDYEPTKKHFVNWQVSEAFRFLKQGSVSVAVQQLGCLKYGVPYLFLRTRIKFIVFGFLGRWKRKLYRIMK